jgi:dephospho-CoA kinase
VIIGLTGTNGAGKGTVAEYLKKIGFSYHSLSDAIRDELKSQNLEASRENLIGAGNNLRESFGPSILALRISRKLIDGNNYVVDSIRNPHEINALRERVNFHLLAIDAPIELRYQRCLARGRNESAATLEEFRIIEDREKSGDETAQQIHRCMEMADLKIINSGSVEELNSELESVLKKIEQSETAKIQDLK